MSHSQTGILVVQCQPGIFPVTGNSHSHYHTRDRRPSPPPMRWFSPSFMPSRLSTDKRSTLCFRSLRVSRSRCQPERTGCVHGIQRWELAAVHLALQLCLHRLDAGVFNLRISRASGTALPVDRACHIRARPQSWHWLFRQSAVRRNHDLDIAVLILTSRRNAQCTPTSSPLERLSSFAYYFYR